MLVWIVAQSIIPALGHKSLIDIGIDLLLSGAWCCGFIVWYLDRGHQFQEETAARRVAEREQRLAQIAAIAYQIGFQDGGDEERRNAPAVRDLGNLIHLDMRRPEPPQPPPDWHPPDDHHAHGASWA